MTNTSPTDLIGPDGEPLRLVELLHPSGLRLTLMDWGATWLSCRVTVGNAEREVLLGCACLEDYFTQTAFLGATIGRFANRIAHSHFSRDGQVYRLVPNEGKNQLHGGPHGFDRRRWRIVEQSAEHVVFGIESVDGDQGFPGNLVATVGYRVQADARISVDYTATVDAPCPVSLTNHAYFNLDGAATDIRNHELQIDAHFFLPIDSESIPLGALSAVENTGFDFTRSKPVGQDFLRDSQQQLTRGYDHSYRLGAECCDMAKAAATLVSGDGRVAMDLFTTMPAMQLYSGNYLDDVPSRQGGVYAAYQGLALETQFLPDSPNHPEWPQPDCWLQPGQTYRHTTALAFRALD